MLAGLGHDFRDAMRSLRRSPGFAATAIGVLALGIGGTVTALGLTSVLVYRELPVPRPDRLVAVRTVDASGGTRNVFTHPAYERLRDTPGTWMGAAAFGLRPVLLDAGGGEQSLVAAFSSPGYFAVLGIRPAAGRFFSGADAGSEALPEVVLSHRLWRERFGSDPGLPGRTVRMNGLPLVVAGVAPAEFQGTIGVVATDVWISLAAYELLFPQRELDAPDLAWLQVFGRLADGVGHERARATLTATVREVASRGLEPVRGIAADVVPMRGLAASTPGRLPRLDLLLVGMALLVLCVASANVAGLLGVRSARRSGGIAVRAALGASPGRLLRTQMAEVLLLWAAGCALGLLLARHAGSALLPRLIPVPPEFPVRVAWEASLDPRTVAAALLVTLGTAAVFGTAPALRAAHVPPLRAVRDSDGNQRRSRVGPALPALQLAAALVLLSLAALLFRTLQHASGVRPGFDPDGVELAAVDLEAGRVPEDEVRGLRDRIRQAVEEAPGLQGALASTIPLVGPQVRTPVAVPSTGAELEVVHSAVTDGFFRTLRIPLLEGRGFSRTEPVPVAILSRGAADRLGLGRGPVGARVRVGLRRGERHVEMALVDVVGIVGDAQWDGTGRAAPPAIYLPLAHDYAPRFYALARGPGAGDGTLLPRVVRAVRPDLPIREARAYREAILHRMPQRPVGALVGGLAAFSLLLAAMGLAATVGSAVVARTREIGVRVSLGAGRADVLRLVLRPVVAAFALGSLGGLAAALAAGRLASGLLAGVSSADPVALVAAVLVLFCGTLAACLVPAQRALRVSPLEALRTE